METIIVPRGRFPHPIGEQNLDLGALVRIVHRARQAKRDLVVDYAHASLIPGEPAEAAGWVSPDRMRVTGDGIVAEIRWTPDAEEAVASARYRFLSPVLEMRNGAITGLYNLGLTNNPNIDAMPPLSNQKTIEEMTTMDDTVKTAVKEALGMAPDAPDELVAEAFVSLFPDAIPDADDDDDAKVTAPLEAAPEKPSSLADLLGDEVLAALGIDQEKVDDEDIVAAIVSLATDAATLKETAVEKAVNDAVAAGRLAPRLAGWAKGLAWKNPEALTAYLVNAGPAVPLGRLITPQRADDSSLNDDEAALCRSLGITPDDYRRFNR